MEACSKPTTARRSVPPLPITQLPSPHKFPPASWKDGSPKLSKLQDFSPPVVTVIRKLPSASWMLARSKDTIPKIPNLDADDCKRSSAATKVPIIKQEDKENGKFKSSGE
jgi:hypothetical protein